MKSPKQTTESTDPSKKKFDRTQEIKVSRSLLLEKLEDRILFDAAGIPADLQQLDFSVEQLPPQVETSPDAVSSTASSSAREIVFIDSQIENASELLDDILKDRNDAIQIVFLSPVEDGIEQIASFLESEQNISAVHIISHGSQGELQLGDSIVDVDSMQSVYSNRLRTIGESLTDDGDILIYGCEFAEGSRGAIASQKLAELTGADVAASTDLTGNSNLNGDWDLEFKVGLVEAASFHATNGNWRGTLATGIVDFENVTWPNGSLSQTINNADTGNEDVDISFSGDTNRIQSGPQINTFNRGGFGNPGGTSLYVYANYSDPNQSLTVDFDFSHVGGVSDLSFTIFDIDSFPNGFGDQVTVTASTNSGTTFDLDPTTLTSSAFNQVSGTNTIFSLDQGNTGGDGVEGNAFFEFSQSGITNVRIVYKYPDTGTATNPQGQAMSIHDINFSYIIPPTIDLDTTNPSTDYTTSFAEGDAPVNIIPTTPDVADPDDTQMASLTLDVGGVVDGDFEVVTFGATSFSLGTSSTQTATIGGNVFNIDYDFASSQFTITQSGGGEMDISDVEVLLAATTYENQSQDPTEGDRTIAATVNDGSADSNVATTTISVTAVNDAPVGSIPDQSDFDADIISLDISGFFSDAEGDILTYSASGLPSGLSISGAGLITGTIDADASVGGPYSVTVTVSDGNGGSTDETFTWNVTNVVPVAGDDTFGANEDTVVSGSVTGNDSDADGDSVSYSLDSGPSNGTLIFNSNGSFTYTPDANFNGTDTFDYTIDDGEGGTDTATVTINVASINDQPVGTTIPNQSDSDADVISLDVSGFFSDVDGDTLTYSATGLPGGLSISSAGLITGTINSDASVGGPYSVTVTVSDGNGGSTDETFTWNIANVVPVANDDTFGTNEDTAISGSVTGNDSDADGDSVTYSLDAGPSNGTLIFNSNGSFTYTPDANFNGTDTFEYTIDDGEGGTDTATVTINVASINDQPVGTTIPNQSDSDADVINLDVSGFFSDVDGDTLTYSASGLPGGLSISGAGLITGTIDADASVGGPYSVTVSVSDGNGGSTDETFTWNVANVVPVANDDTFGTNEDTAISGSVTGNDSDADGDTVTYSLDAGPSNGTLIFNSNGSFTYTPDPNFNGTDTFDYTIDDGEGGTDTATVTINVATVNDQPIGSTIPNQSDSDSDVVNFDVSGFFSDVDGDTLTYSASGLPSGLSINSAGLITGTIDADASVGGPYSVTVSVSDGNSGSTDETFTWNVANVVPVANDDTFGTNEDTAISGSVTGNDSDADGDTVTYSLDAGPSNGTLIFNSNGSFTYTPDANFNGTDTFDYTIDDGEGGTDTATVTINVASINDQPVGTTIPNQSDSDADVISLDVTGFFSDVDGDTLTYAATGLPGGLSISSAGLITGTIDADASVDGPYSVTVTVSDGNGGSADETFNWNVANVVPVANDDTFGTNEDTAISGSVTGNDSDADGDTVSYSLDAGPSNGTLTFNNNGSFRYTPDANFNGSDTFGYTIDDGEGGTDSATVTVNVASINDQPVGTTIPDQSDSDSDVISLDVSGFFSDVDGDTLTYSATGLPSGLSINSAGLITGTIDADASVGGPYSVTVPVSDGNGGSTDETFTWNVANVVPIANDDSFGTNEDTAVSGSVTGNDSDADGDTVTYSLDAGPTNGTLIFNSNGSFTYTPDANFNGTDTFDYTIDDGEGGTDTASVTINVASINDQPVGTTIPNQSDSDADVINLGVSGFFSDVDGDTLTYSATGLPSGLSISSAGLITGTIDADASVGGPYSVTVTVSDGNGGSTDETFTWIVANVVPVANDDTFATNEDTAVSGSVTGNDSDADGDTVTYSLDAGPTNGTLIFNSNGSFTYTPDANFNGTDTFDYTIDDGEGGTDTASVTINVASINDQPVGTTIPDQSDSDSDLVSVDVSGFFSDVDGDTLTYSATGLPGGLSISSAGLISGTIDADASVGGPYSVNVSVSDGNGGSTDETFTWNVANVVPVAGDDTFGTNEDTAISGSVTGNDSDADGDSVTYSLDAGPTNGILIFNSNGSFTYTPDANFNGTDTFDYTIDDGEGGTDTATVTINVASINDQPVGSTILDQSDSDADVISLDVSGFFSDVDGDTLTYSATGLPGGLSISSAGLITGTIDADASIGGPYSVTVSVSDGNGGSTDETFTWNIANVVPVANDDTFGTNEDTAITGSVTGNDSDADGDTVTYSLDAGPSNGTMTFNSNGSFTYTPDANFNGTDTFDYTIDDGEGGTDTATVTINVASINDQPVGTTIPDQSDSDADVVSLDVSGFFSDVDGDTLTYSASSLPGGLSISSAGLITGTIDADASVGGPYSVTVTVSDGNGGSTDETFTWNVANVVPVANDDTFGTSEDTTVSGSVTGNDSDADGDSVTYSLNTGPTNGTLIFNSNGSFTYTPDPNFNGTDTFDYAIDDGEGGTDTATVTINVASINDQPVGTTIPNQSDSDSDVISLDVTGFFSDVDGDTLTYSATGLPSGLSISSAGLITGTIDADASVGGPYSVTVTVSDGNGGSTDETFTWNVTNVVPVAGDDTFGANEDTPISGSVTGNDSDADGDSVTYSLDAGPSNGTLIFNSNGSFTYTPDANFNGTDTFDYTIDDGEGGTDSATVTVNVASINDQPAGSTIPNQSDSDSDVVSLDVTGFFSDVDGDTLTYSATGLPGGLSISSAGLITGTIDADASVGGPYSVTVTVSDGNGGSTDETFNWNVANVVPVANDDTFGTNEDTAISGSVTGNDSDADGDTVSYSLDAGPSNGTLTFNNDGSFTYTPDANFNGSDTFGYTIDDGEGGTDSATVTVNVASINDQPVGTTIPDQSDSDSDVVSLNVSGFFSDVDGDTLTYSATALPGGLSISGAGLITGTIDADASVGGPYSITVTVSDGNGGSTDETFTWNVANVVPVANDDTFGTSEDTAISGSVTGNDSDADGDSVTFSLDAGPTNETLIFNSNGSFTYTPDANFNGTDTFEYTIDDGEGGTDTATVTINVASINDQPAGTTIPDQSDSDADVVSFDVSGFFSDVDGDSLAYSASGLPSGLSISSAGLITGTIDADASVSGPYSVTVSVSDGNGGSTDETFTWNVANVVPVANDDTFGTNEDTAISGSVTGNDSDADGDTVTYSLDAGPSNGTLIFNNNGSFTYTPDANFNGTDTFDYIIDDGEGGTDSATVTINIASINDQPVGTTIPDQSDSDSDVVSFDVSGFFSDIDGDTLTYSATGLPSGLSISSAGLITGTINADASVSGPYSVTVSVSDGNGGSTDETFNWNVANVVPVAGDDTFGTNEDVAISGSVTGNDSDADGDTVTYSLDAGPTNGTLIFSSNGSFTYTPDANFNGSDTFDYIIDDDEGGTDTATVTINVDSINDQPAGSTIPDQSDSDADVVSLDVSGFFSDVDGDTLTYSATGLPSGLSINSAGLIIGTIDADASVNGPYTVTVSVSDGNGGSTDETFTWNVANVVPVANDDTFGTNEDTAISGSVTGNDSDADGDSVVYSLDSGPTNGILIFNSNGSFTYTPDANFNESDTFDYTIDDGEGGTDTATVTINVASINDQPAGTTIPNQSDSDSDVVSLDVSGFFSDVDGDTLTYSATGLPGGLSISSAGLITGSLDADASVGGPYSVTVTVSDGNGGSTNETFTWNIANVVPVANDDTFGTNEDTAISGSVTGNDSDADGDSVTYSLDAGPSNGTLVFNGNGSFTYTPDANFNGTDTFDYTIDDGEGGTDTATVTINVNNDNDVPVGTTIPDQSDSDAVIVSLDVSGFFSDVDGDTLTYSATSLPGGLSTSSAGLITGTIDADASVSGPYSVTVSVSDGNGGSTDETFTWNVANVVPVAGDDTFGTNEDTAISGSVTGNDSDADGDTVTYSLDAGPSNGTLVFNSNGSFTYSPDANFNGTDTFDYTIDDGEGGTDTATVTINVNNDNDAPVGSTIPNQSDSDANVVSLDVSGFFSDVDGDTLTYSATGLPGGLSISSAGLITGTIDSDASVGGPYSVTVSVSDGNGGSTDETFTWNVANVVPVANDDTFGTNEDTAISGSVTGNDSDADGDSVTYSLDAGPSNGTLIFNSNGSFTYTPDTNFNGTDTFDYTIDDGEGGTDTASVTINVASINDQPVGSTIPDQSDSDANVISFDVSGFFSDVDGDSLTYSATGLPGGLSISSAGLITGTIDADASIGGPYSVTVSVSDGNGGSADETFTWNAANVVPVANDDTFGTNEDTAISGSVTGNDSDSDGDSVTYSLDAGPSNGTLIFNSNGSFTYTPDANFNGSDTFDYTIDDGEGGTDSATVTINIASFNDQPVGTTILNQSDSDADIVSLDVSGFFSDVDGDTLTYSATSLPGGLSISSAGLITGTINSDASVGGPYSVTVSVSDGNGGSTDETFTWNVANVIPVANDDTFGTSEDTAISGSVTGNDSDADGDSVTYSLDAVPSNGTLTFNSNGSFTYTPDANFNGTDTFDYTIDDGEGGTDTATVTINVASINDQPVGSTILDQSDSDADVISFDVSGFFSDVDGDTLTYSATGLPGGLSISSAGLITGTIDADASVGGPYSVTVSVSDGNGGSTDETFTWNIANVVPVANDDTFATNEDTAISGSVTGNDSDADGDSVSHSLDSGPSNGTLVFNSNGSFTYTPDANFNGTDTFDYTIDDGEGGTDTATVTINVASNNDQPIGTTIPDQSDSDADVVSVDTSGFFSDIDGDTLTYSTTGLPSGLSISSAGLITGTIDADASVGGPYSVTVTVSDGNGGSTNETFTWNVANVVPVAGDDTFGTNEDTAISGSVTGNDSDADGDSVTYSLNAGPTNGTLIFNSNGSFTYTPDANFNGTDTFDYTIDDGEGGTDSATVTINIASINDQPVGTTIPNQSDSDADVINLDVTGFFSDVDGDTLTYSATGLPSGLSISGAGLITGTIDVDASVGGPYSVTVTVSDGNGGSTDETFNWNVANVVPVANDDTFGTNEDTAVSGSVTGNDSDADGDSVTYSLDAGPSNGTLTFNSNGSFTYTHDVNFNGSDTFDYTIDDGEGGTDTATVTINVASINDQPVGTTIPNQSDSDSDVISLDVTGFFSDVDGDTLTYSATGLPSGLSISSAGLITGSLDADASVGGPYSVTVTVSDGNGGSTNETFTWNIANVVPVANDDTFGTNEDTAISGSVTGNDSDADGDSVTYSLDAGPSNGTLVFNGNGSFTYTPDANFNGTDTFDYTIDDGEGGTDTATVTINVNNDNDVPVGTTIPDQSDSDADIVSLDVSGFFSDVDGDTLTYSATSLPGGLSISSAGLITGTINSDASVGGPYSVTVTVSDGNGGSTDETFTWNIANVVPVANDDTSATNEDTAISGSVTGNDSDADGDSVAYSLDSGPTNGTLIFNSNGSFTYTPDANFNGTETFDYTIDDGEGGTDSATVTINVATINDQPVGTTIPDQSDSDADVVSLDVSGFFSDVDGDTLTYSATGLPGGLSISSAGLITGTIDSDASVGGPYSVTVTVSDGNGGSTDETFTWNVANVVPVANDDTFGTNEDTAISGSVTGNDSDADGDSVVYSLDSGPTNGILIFNSNGSFTYTPDANFNGTDTFDYTIDDGEGGTDSATVTINVASINDQPVGSTIPDQSDSDANVISFDVSGFFSDVDGDSLTYSASGLPGGLSISSAGLITGTIDADASVSGPYSVTVTVSDGNSGSTDETFTWNVANVVPVAGDDTFGTNEDAAISGSVTGNDSDADGDTVTYSLDAGPSNGTLIFNSNGSFTYTPDANFNGTDTFDYTIDDGEGGTDTATVTINVASINDQPVGTTIPNQSDSDSDVISLDVTGFFSDVDGDTLTYSATGLPGGLSISSAGLITGTIDADASVGGPYSVTVSVSDGNGGSTDETFTWNVANVVPVANDDTFGTNEDTAISGSVTGNDSDADGDTVTYSLDAGPTNGTLIFNSNGSFIYTPDANFNGTDTFDYTIDDGEGGTDTATVTINVASINDQPVGNTIPDQGDSDANVVSFDVSGFFSDVDGDSLTYSASGLPSGLSIDSAGLITGTIDADASVSGPYSVTVSVSDGNGGSTDETFTWNVANVVPVAGDDTFGTNEDTAISGSVTGNDSDADGDTVTYSLDAGPSNGTLIFSSNGSFTYTPDANFNGTDTFDYSIDDGEGGTDTATVTINVNNDNDAPVGSTIPDHSDSDADVVSLDVSGFFSDVDGDTLTYSATGLPGGLSISSAGLITGTINSDASVGGPYSVTVSVSDGNGGSTDETFTWNVANVVPVANDDTFGTNEDTAISGSVTGNDSDADGDSITYSLDAGPSNGTLIFDNNGSFTYTPDPNFNGTDAFDYTIDDGEGGTDTATVTINVNNDNDAPVGSTIPDQSDSDADVVSVDVSGFFGDVDGDTLTYSATGLPGGLSISSAGLITGTIDADASVGGPYSVTVSVSDGNGGSADEAFTWNVANVVPVAGDDTFGTNEDTAISGSVAGNDSDADGDSVNYSLDAGPTNGTLIFNSNGSFTYTPDANFNGSDTFDYTIDDGEGGTDTATVTINVASINDQPVGTTIPNQSDSDADVVSLDVTGFFSDVDGDALTYSATGLLGGLSINSAGLITGTIDADASVGGPYSVTVTVSDGNGGSTDETFTWNVANVVPVANDDTFGTNEDTVISGSVTGNDSDADGDTVTYSLDAGPSNGTLTFNSNGSFTYTPDVNFNGSDTFDYTIDDGEGGTDTATVTINVASINDQPVGTTIPDQSDSDADVVSLDVSGFFGDVDGDTLTYSATGLPGGLSISSAGLITGTIDADASVGGPYSVTVSVSDGNGGSTDETFTWNVANVVPVAGDDYFSVDENSILTGDVSLNDFDLDGDALSFAVSNQPTNGTVQMNSDGSFVYTPAANFDGTDSFEYEVCDDSGDCVRATVEVTVIDVNKPPTVNDETVIVGLGQTVVVPVLANDFDLDGDPITLSLIETLDPLIGKVFAEPGGNVRFVPNPGFVGTVQIPYVVHDDQGGFSKGVLTIEVQTRYRFDTFNDPKEDFSNDKAGVEPVERGQRLSRSIYTLAPEPIFSGYARPGTQVQGKIYDSSGRLIGERHAFSDPGGNWMMQFHDVNGQEYYRVEFEQVAGSMDVYGYLGLSPSDNTYQAMQPLTKFDEPYRIQSVESNSAYRSLESEHRLNSNSMGFGESLD